MYEKEIPIECLELTRLLFLRWTCCYGVNEDWCVCWDSRLRGSPTPTPCCLPLREEQYLEGDDCEENICQRCYNCIGCLLASSCCLVFPLACILAGTTAACVRTSKTICDQEYSCFPYYYIPEMTIEQRNGIREEEHALREQQHMRKAEERRRKQPQQNAHSATAIVAEQPRMDRLQNSGPTVTKSKSDNSSRTMIQRIPQREITFMPEQKLGKGAFGIVYQGKWHNMDVAIKQFKDGIQQNDTKAFYKEASTLAKVQHPHVVILYGAVTDRNPNCLVMELMTESLEEVLHDKGRKLPWSKKKKYALDVAQGLQHLHQNRVLHRDLKSSNVLVDKAGSLKLADFGLARVVGEMKKREAYIGDGQKGTVTHMAPELFSFQAKYTEFSDVYAYAMTLWEIASRKIPYASAAHPCHQVIIALVGQGDRETIPEKTPQVLRQIIEGCWAAEPQQRPMLSNIIAQLEDSLKPKKSVTTAGQPAFPQMYSNPMFAGNLDSAASAPAEPMGSAAMFAGNFDSNMGTNVSGTKKPSSTTVPRRERRS